MTIEDNYLKAKREKSVNLAIRYANNTFFKNKKSINLTNTTKKPMAKGVKKDG